MAEPELVKLPERRELPEVVELNTDEGMPPHSPRETSMLKQMTGSSFAELVGPDADDGDRECVLVWFKLRRLGYEPTFEEARDVLVRYVQPDPTSGGEPTTLPPSAATGE